MSCLREVTSLKRRINEFMTEGWQRSTQMSLGSFGIDDGDRSENVTFKIMNSRFFKLRVVYSKFLKMLNVDKCPRIDFLGTVLKFRKRMRNC